MPHTRAVHAVARSPLAFSPCLPGLSSLCFNLISRRIIVSVRETLFRQLIKQDIAFFDGMRTGDLTQRLGSDVRAWYVCERERDRRRARVLRLSTGSLLRRRRPPACQMLARKQGAFDGDGCVRAVCCGHATARAERDRVRRMRGGLVLHGGCERAASVSCRYLHECDRCWQRGRLRAVSKGQLLSSRLGSRTAVCRRLVLGFGERGALRSLPIGQLHERDRRDGVHGLSHRQLLS